MTSLGDERKPASGTDFRSGWQPVGESFLMNESIAVREWRNQGHLARQRDVLLRVLRTKLSGEDLAMVIERVEKQDDLEVLSRWFDLSLALSPEKILDELKG
jgi:hypothetical protein